MVGSEGYSIQRFGQRIIAIVALSICGVVLVAAEGAAGAAPPSPVYAVVVSDATAVADGWSEVVDALVRKHHAQVVRYPLDVDASVPELAALHPDFIAFVARPEEAGRAFVVKVHRLTRRLDSDPYTDARWGIVTGYEAADALRIAQCSAPLRIHCGASGCGIGRLDSLPEGFASNESARYDFWTKSAGQQAQTKLDLDPAQALAEGFNTRAPQYFITSGHASEHDWQIGYTAPAGQFRCHQGKLIAINTRNQLFPIESPEPKVYLAMGNCLAGHISGRDCMATAWMHSGGVDQLIGYTVVTWYGYMGGGTSMLFNTGHLDLAEAFFFNNQALVQRLSATYPQYAEVEFDSYDENRMDEIFEAAGLVEAQPDGSHGQADKDLLGLLWDRDVVAFYGDPAWEARMPEQVSPWRTEFASTAGGRTTFTVTTLQDGSWPSRPIMAWLPERLASVRVVSGSELAPVVTDDFILLPRTGSFKAGEVFTVAYEGRPLVRPDVQALHDLETLKMRLLRVMPEADRPRVLDAVLRASTNGDSLVTALESLEGEAREHLAFLIRNMPTRDLLSIPGTRLVDEVLVAMRTRQESPWGRTLPVEIFEDGVLPYASLDEARDPWRSALAQRFSARAWACKTPGEAAVLLNREVCAELHVQYHGTKRPRANQSPAESIQAGYASCTGLSILVVDACRACGVPARIVGIPSWKDHQGDAQGNHGGNHTWLEVWDTGRWHYLGASESKELDHGWFTAKTKGDGVDAMDPSHRIYAASFRQTGTSFPLAWAPGRDWVPAVDVTGSYAAP